MEGVSNTVSVEIGLLDGALGRNVEVLVFTFNDSALGIARDSYRGGLLPPPPPPPPTTSFENPPPFKSAQFLLQS